MAIRKIILWAMLASVGFAAGYSVFVFIHALSRDRGEEAILVAIVVSLMSGLGYLSSFLVDKPFGRGAGIVGILGAVYATICMVIGIWGFNILSSSLENHLVESAVITFFTIPFAMGFMIVGTFAPGKRVGRAGIILCAMAYVLIQLEILDFNHDNKCYDMGMGIVAFGIPMCLSMIGKEHRVWRYIPMGFGALGIILLGFSIFSGLLAEKGIVSALFDLCWIGGMFNLLNELPLRGLQRIFRIGVLILGVATAVLHAGLELKIKGKLPVEDSTTHILLSCMVCTICGLLALSLFAALSRKPTRIPTRYAPAKPSEMACPCCGILQEMKPGATICVNCRLVFKIDLEEPRCEKCNYSLLMLQSDRCPECGTAAPRAKAVAPTTSSAMGS